MSKNNLKFVNRIEEMTDKDLRERIKYGMNFDIPHKIRPVPYLGVELELVEYKFGELQAFCPMTKISDLYEIIIRFIPNKLIPELKALKLYFWDYRIEGVPISHEHLAAKIFKEFSKIIKPKDIYLELRTAGRGEIFTTIRVGNLELEKIKERQVSNL